MSGSITARLKKLGGDLPKPAAPLANYVPSVKSGSLLFVSGQIAMGENRRKYAGAVGKDIDLEEGIRAARLAALNAVAKAAAALNGDLDRVVRVVKITGTVNAGPEFTQHPNVVNGASDLFVDIFGEAERHARAAVGAPSLPRNASVEIDAIFEIA